MKVANYDITVDGELSPRYEAAFAPHRVTIEDGMTTIRATHIDDAALLALLAQVGDLALSVARVERIDEPSPASTPATR